MPLTPEQFQQLKQGAAPAQPQITTQPRPTVSTGGGLTPEQFQQLKETKQPVGAVAGKTLRDRQSERKIEKQGIKSQLQAPQFSKEAIKAERKEELTPAQRFFGTKQSTTEKEKSELEDRLGQINVSQFVAPIAKPFASFGASAKNILTGQFAKQGSEAYAPDSTKLFGDLYALGTQGQYELQKRKEAGEQITAKDQVKADIKGMLQGAGAGAEIGSYAIGGQGLAPAIKSLQAGLRGAGSQILRQGVSGVGRFAATEGLAGAVGNVGAGLQEEDSSVKRVVGDALIGFGIGAGAGLGGGVALKGLGSAGRGALNAAEVYTPNTLRKLFPDGSEIAVENARKSIAEGWQKTFDVNKGLSRANKKLMDRGVNVSDVYTRYSIVPDIDVKTGRMNVDNAVNEMSAILGEYYDGMTNYIKQFDNKRVAIDDAQEMVISNVKRDPVLRGSGETNKVINQALEMMEDYKTTYGQNIKPSDMNEIRKAMNREWSDDPTKRAAERVIGNIMRTLLDETTGDTVVRSVNKEIGQLINAQDFMDQKLRSQVVGGGRMSQFFARMIGTLIGSGGADRNIIGAALGAFGGDWIVQALRDRALGTGMQRKIIQNLSADRGLLEMLEEATVKAENKNFLRNIIGDQLQLPAGTPGQAPINNAPLRMRGDTVNNFEAPAQNIYMRQ